MYIKIMFLCIMSPLLISHWPTVVKRFCKKRRMHSITCSTIGNLLDTRA